VQDHADSGLVLRCTIKLAPDPCLDVVCRQRPVLSVHIRLDDLRALRGADDKKSQPHHGAQYDNYFANGSNRQSKH